MLQYHDKEDLLTLCCLTVCHPFKSISYHCFPPSHHKIFPSSAAIFFFSHPLTFNKSHTSFPLFTAPFSLSPLQTETSQVHHTVKT